MSKTVQEVAAQNMAHFLERGPGLSYGYASYVVAKDTAQGMVLLGGLGGMGVGQMWFVASESDKNKPGWVEAPECQYQA